MLMSENYKYFTLFIIGLAILASLIGLARYRQLPLSLRYLTLLACFDSVMELTAKLVHDVLHLKNNLFLFPIISIGEIVLLALTYRQVLQSAIFNKIAPWLLGLFTAYALVVSFTQFGIARYAVGLATIMNLLLLGIAGFYFNKLLNELHVEQPLRDPFFWVSAGLAVYGMGNLLIYLFSNYLITRCSIQLQFLVLWGVRNLFNAALYLAYCWALWIAPPKSYAAPAAASTLPRA